MPRGLSQASRLRQVEVYLERYEYDGPGVCLGDGQTEAEISTLQNGRADALFRRMPTYLT